MTTLEQYNKVNDGFKKKLLYRFNSGNGFYSEFNNLVLAMLYCLENKIQFRLTSRNGPILLEKGWQDFFLPFCNESEGFLLKYNSRNSLRKSFKLSKKLILFFIKKLYGVDYLTQDVFNTFRDEYKSRHTNIKIPELGVEGNVKELLTMVSDMIYKFSPLAETKINDILSNFDLPSSYASMHVRAGDKIVEGEIYAANEYMDILKQNSNIKDVFILTDDYRVFEEMQRNHKDFKFYTTCKETEKGYYYRELVAKSKKEVYQEHIKLLASIELIKNSELAVVPYNANPGMFLGMHTKKARIIGVDNPSWFII